MLFLLNCFGCGFDLISIHYNEGSQQWGSETLCTSGEALLVQEAAASGQFTQQKRVLVYEWVFLVLACCFLPRIHDCELNCSCWFITSLLGYKVGLLSNSSLKNNKKQTKKTHHTTTKKPLLLISLGWYFTSSNYVAVIKTKHVLCTGRTWVWFTIFDKVWMNTKIILF